MFRVEGGGVQKICTFPRGWAPRQIYILKKSIFPQGNSHPTLPLLLDLRIYLQQHANAIFKNECLKMMLPYFSGYS